jgi:hypothetical protein
MSHGFHPPPLACIGLRAARGRCGYLRDIVPQPDRLMTDSEITRSVTVILPPGVAARW